MTSNERELTVAIENGVRLKACLVVPENASAIVLFAHGSGSGRDSPRNRYVARVLQRAGLATFLFDLLTGEEELAERATGHLWFEVGLIAERLRGVAHWLRRDPVLQHLAIGYFGSSMGAAAALVAAAHEPEQVGAVVSRGGRPDLAGEELLEVRAPTLLIVGGDDELVVELNRDALELLQAEKRLEIVPGATHLFEESGALENVAVLARRWFSHYLVTAESRWIPDAKPMAVGSHAGAFLEHANIDSGSEPRGVRLSAPIRCPARDGGPRQEMDDGDDKAAISGSTQHQEGCCRSKTEADTEKPTEKNSLRPRKAGEQGEAPARPILSSAAG
jgi:putative phosphoribosyl transferase